MAGAPSVRYPVRRSPFLAMALGLVWLAGFLALAWAWPVPSWRWGLGAVTLLLAGAAAWRFWLGTAEGEFRWDGGAWYAPGELPVSDAPVVRFDGLRWLLVLVRVVGPGTSPASCWLWLEAAADPPAWTALRRALFSGAVPGPASEGIAHE